MALLGLLGAFASAGLAEQGRRPLVFGVNRVGDGGLLYNPPDYLEHMYQRIREAGGTCVRLAASPRDIEARRGKRDWREFDRDLDLAIRYGQEPIVCIVNTPAWASPTGEATHLYPYKTELLGEFADFCTELARRTRGRVKCFQLWNEQNGCSWHFHDGFNHADEYLPVLKVCYHALKKANPDCVLSLGSLDDAEGNAPIFLRKTYEEMAKQSVRGPVFDAVSDHPYSDNAAIARGKLDALREIMIASGHGNKPFWITEYGWHTGHMKPADQAARLAETLEAFIQPAWGDLEAAVYLSIADFEGTTTGFGLTDANLRPRPAFYAFQAASRFGAYPPYQIQPVFLAAGSLAISWETLKPTTGLVTIARAGDGTRRMQKASARATRHRVEIGGLKPDAVYRFFIETTCGRGGLAKTTRSAGYEVRCPGRQVFNGNFESGFFAGIANGWVIKGDGFCTDAALIPFTRVAEDQHAQVVFARGDKKHEKIDSTLSTVVAATPAKPIHLSLSWAGTATKTSARVVARAGIDPTGGIDPNRRGIEWTAWHQLGRLWEQRTLSANAANSVVRLFVQCRSEGTLDRGSVAFMLDHVRVVPGSR